MTSVVRVQAHCTPDKEVVVRVIDVATSDVKSEQVLKDKETVEKHIYDNQGVVTFERLLHIDAGAEAPADE
ncbi:hypothetical protein D3C81_288190 [compost metagenome]